MSLAEEGQVCMVGWAPKRVVDVVAASWSAYLLDGADISQTDLDCYWNWKLFIKSTYHSKIYYIDHWNKSTYFLKIFKTSLQIRRKYLKIQIKRSNYLNCLESRVWIVLPELHKGVEDVDWNRKDDGGVVLSWDAVQSLQVSQLGNYENI